MSTSKFTRDQARLIFALLDTIGDDGHTIWQVSVMRGFPPELIERFTEVHRSDPRDPKRTISGTDGAVIGSVLGVYGLAVLAAICTDLGLLPETKIGRGQAAQACTVAIRQALLQPFHDHGRD